VYEILERCTPGQTLRITRVRRGEKEDVSAQAEPFPPEVVPDLGERLLGLDLAPVDGGGYRVAAVKEGSGAAQVGFQPGDRVLAVNGRALEGETSLRRALLDLLGRPRALVVVQRGRGRYHVQVPLGS
jgi:S1-C subfamily serine protease